MDPDIEKNFLLTINNYKAINNNIKYINNDIINLTTLHDKFIKDNKKITCDAKNIIKDLCIYLDDIHFQKKNLEIENEALKSIYYNAINKYYRDFFKVYIKIINTLINILLENRDIIINLFNIKNNIDIKKKKLKKLKKKMNYIIKEFENKSNDNQIIKVIKKKCINSIKLYNDINDYNDIQQYDIINIFNTICNKYEELVLSCTLIKYHIRNTKTSVNKGIMGDSYLINKYSYYDKINIECDTIKKFIASVINNHLVISIKYKNRSKLIDDEIIYKDNVDYLNINNLISSNSSKNSEESISHYDNFSDNIIEENKFPDQINVHISEEKNE